MYAAFRTRSRCTAPTRTERGPDGPGEVGRACVPVETGGTRARVCAYGRGQTLWDAVGVERMKALPFHCHWAGFFTSGQQLGTSSEE